MKKGLVIKSDDTLVSSEELALINQYTRRELSADEVYVFSVVLCDNDIDRDFERFTVESLFSLEKLFVGKTGIFDHMMSAKNQTARIFHCEVEAVEGKKTITGDDYFRLKARAYIPRCESNCDVILSLDSGIIKEVSVGCAVKSTLCSICGNDVNSLSCTHKKGEKYNSKLCYGEMVDPFDAYEFSFVAVPAQRNAGVIKSYTDKKENIKMKDLLSAIKKGKDLSLDDMQVKSLSSYIEQLESEAECGRAYKKSLQESLLKMMCVKEQAVPVDTLKGIVDKLSIKELETLSSAYKAKTADASVTDTQLCCNKNSEHNKSNNNNQFTI